MMKKALLPLSISDSELIGSWEWAWLGREGIEKLFQLVCRGSNLLDRFAPHPVPCVPSLLAC